MAKEVVLKGVGSMTVITGRFGVKVTIDIRRLFCSSPHRAMDNRQYDKNKRSSYQEGKYSDQEYKESLLSDEEYKDNLIPSGAVVDWEEEEDLLNWSRSLDYEAYVNDWKLVGTTGGVVDWNT